MEKKKCSGCGTELQNNQEDKIGYVKDFSQLLCKRCYEMKHFNKVPDTFLSNNEYVEILKSVSESKQLVIWVLDIFDFYGSYITLFDEYLKNNPVIIVANKVDLFPKSVNMRKLKNWIIDSISSDIDIKDVIITSAEKNYNIDYLVDTVKEFCNKNVYVVGVTNTGKSTLINNVIRSLNPSYTKKIITSYFAGTTLGMIKIPLNKKISMIDTPGIINDKQLTNILTLQSLKLVVPKGEIRPATYQLDSNQTLFLTGLIQMNFLSGEKTSFTAYISNAIKPHRTKYATSEELRERHLGENLLSPPNQEELKKIKSFKKVTFEIIEKKVDIVFSGIGWVTINNVGEKISLEVIVPDFTDVTTRKSIIGG